MDVLALLDADATDPVDDAVLEDAVWAAVCDRVDAGTDLPDVVGDWFLTRLCAWDTFDAGLAHTAVHHAEDLPAMVAAWQRLGADALARLYRDAAHRTRGLERLPPEVALVRAERACDPLEDDVADALDDADAIHAAWIRAHRATFRAALGG